MPPHKGGKKNRKHGRNVGKGGHRRDKCLRYAAEHRRVKNNPARKQRDTERSPH
jgi:hypothetical protein